MNQKLFEEVLNENKFIDKGPEYIYKKLQEIYDALEPVVNDYEAEIYDQNVIDSYIEVQAKLSGAMKALSYAMEQPE